MFLTYDPNQGNVIYFAYLGIQLTGDPETRDESAAFRGVSLQLPQVRSEVEVSTELLGLGHLRGQGPPLGPRALAGLAPSPASPPQLSRGSSACHTNGPIKPPGHRGAGTALASSSDAGLAD